MGPYSIKSPTSCFQQAGKMSALSALTVLSWRLAALAVVFLLASCDYAAKWRDAQVAESHSLAQGDKIIPPVSPPAKAADLTDDLPVEASWPVLEYSASGGSVTAKLLSTAGAEQTAVWIHERFAQMGYATSDNFSRIL